MFVLVRLTESEPKLSPRASTGSIGSSKVGFISSASRGESELPPGVSSPSLGSVHAAGSEPELSPGVPLVSMGSGGIVFAVIACLSLGESRLLPGGSASPVGPLYQICGWSSRDVGLTFRVSITGSSAVMGSSLGLRHTSSLPVGEACASSGMGFRAPESLKGSFAGLAVGWLVHRWD